MNIKLKIISFLIIIFQVNNAYAFDIGKFFSDIFTSKAGGKAVDYSEGRSIEQFQTPGKCRKILPWSEPKIKDPELVKRMLYICRTSYYAQYDPMLKMPISVSEVLTKTNMIASKEPGNTTYDQDPDMPTNLQISLDDYKNSGYEQVSMASPPNMFIYDESLNDESLLRINQKSIGESFFMTNSAPQVPNLKKGIWKELEIEVRNLATQTENLYITTGPVFAGGNAKSLMSAKKIPVPTHYYKLIADPSTYGSVAYVIPNKEVITSRTKTIRNPADAYYCGGAIKRFCELTDFVVTIKELENLTGLEFYPILAPYYAVQVKQDISQIFKNKRKININ